MQYVTPPPDEESSLHVQYVQYVQYVQESSRRGIVHVQYVVDVEGRLSASVSRDSEDSSFVNVGTTTTTHAPDVGTGTEVEDIDEAGTESKQGGAKLTLLVEEEARALNVAAQSRSSSLLPIFIIIGGVLMALFFIFWCFCW